jgi:hypothetical protein
MCFDLEHRLSSERCLNYYDSLTPEQIAANNSTDPSGTTCPGFLSETDQSKNNNSNNSSETMVSIIFIVVGVAVGIAFTAMMILFLAKRQTFVSTTTAGAGGEKKDRMSWYEDNPISKVGPRLSMSRRGSSTSAGTGGGGQQLRRQTSLNPFKKSESYVEISEVSMPSEILGDVDLEGEGEHHDNLGSGIY